MIKSFLDLDEVGVGIEGWKILRSWRLSAEENFSAAYKQKSSIQNIDAKSMAALAGKRGLVAYDESSEEEEIDVKEQSHVILTEGTSSSSKPGIASKVSQDRKKPNGTHTLGGDSEILGPVIGPSRPDIDYEMENSTSATSAPQSPYSKTRALIREVTLPTHPNLDIPPSPPGSPPAAARKKFSDFRKLKKSGSHFNQKLAQSAALKNPAFAPKLLEFAGVDEDAQWQFSLPPNLCRSVAYPPQVFKDGLAANQRRVQKENEERRIKEPRTSIDFVPSKREKRSHR
ncbi:MAG: hypothetical protein M1814_000966 [Vezdaea aestivalis]|nr:MAG: hypothetical protein M1814_000966 [Vezdaea aestivalis]